MSRVLIPSTHCSLVLLLNESSKEGYRWFGRRRGSQLLWQTLRTLVLADGLCRFVLQLGKSMQVGQGTRQGKHWVNQ